MVFKNKYPLNCFQIGMFFFLMLGSCVSQEKLEFLQDPVVEKNLYQLHEKAIVKIRPNDELYIRVSSFDDVAFNFFSSQTSSNYMNYSNEMSISLISYLVNDSGFINFPILGQVFLNDLTIEEATEKLRIQLSEYFNQPTVILKLVNKKITVIGEVTVSGTYTYTKDRISVFEAISLAGDVTVHGNLKEVYLIRSLDDTIIKTKLDLTEDKILTSENYFVQPNDIIYVRPRPSAKWSVVSIPVSLVLSAITTFLLILNYFQ